MSNQYEDDIRSSLGAILLGGFGSVAYVCVSSFMVFSANFFHVDSLSGVVALQTFLYFRLYRADHWGIKALVAWLWYVPLYEGTCPKYS